MLGTAPSSSKAQKEQDTLYCCWERGKGPEKGEAPSGRKQNRGRRERNGCPGHGVRSPGI